MSLGSICGPTLEAILVLGIATASEQPACLWPAIDVQHVVRHVRAGHVVGDHLHAECAACPGVSSMSARRDERGWA